MHLSTNTRYAVRLLFELREPGPPVPTARLAERIGIPLKTVERIHAVLRQNGMTDGTVGVRGGIFLLQPLTAISLGQIVTLFDEGVKLAVCHGDKANECPMWNACSVSSAWNGISKLVQSALDGISLWSILRESSEAACPFG
ncbi:MAG: Rrf2 family transcriptional regulator [Desulfovibrio sp.]|jgi:Rrf2 family iron-sulfur cluster assembly transcriptional regulator|nr:Rrf2 family transcriptional regulator [Desulfovibrio sp.]